MATVKFSPRRSRTEQQTPDYVHQFLVVLCGTDPLVWRRIQVPPSYSFWDLHVAIQDAMGWEDRHLHEFRLFDDAAHRTIAIGIPTDMSSPDYPVVPSWTVPLSKYFDARTGRLPITYLYDFGDGWEHVISHEGFAPIKPSQKYPRCHAGERRCPPEDCGGVHGYTKFLKAVADSKHRRHAEMTKWIGSAWRPDDFKPRRVVFDDPQKRWARAFQR
jgi:hypothetical protein